MPVTVEDAGAQHAFQAEAVLRGLDFLAVLPAHRGDEVGEDQRALQEIHLAEEFHLGDGEQVPGQREQRQGVRRKQALVSHVVDGEDGGHVAEGGVFGVLRAQQDGHQRGLPVVAVKDLGHAENLRSFQHGAGKQGEALGVVGIVAGGGAVKGVAVEKRRVLDEVEADAGVLAAADDRAEAVAVVEGNGDALDHGLRILEQGLAVAGKIDADLVAGGSQGPGQRAHYVGQSAGFGKWHTLRGRENDVHEATPCEVPARRAGTRYHRVLLTAYSAGQSNRQSRTGQSKRRQAGRKEGQRDKNRGRGKASQPTQTGTAFSGRFRRPRMRIVEALGDISREHGARNRPRARRAHFACWQDGRGG